MRGARIQCAELVAIYLSLLYKTSKLINGFAFVEINAIRSFTIILLQQSIPLPDLIFLHKSSQTTLTITVVEIKIWF